MGGAAAGRAGKANVGRARASAYEVGIRVAAVIAANGGGSRRVGYVGQAKLGAVGKGKVRVCGQFGYGKFVVLFANLVAVVEGGLQAGYGVGIGALGNEGAAGRSGGPGS